MKRVYKQGIGVGLVVLMAAPALALVNRGCVAHRETDYLATIKTDFGDITIRLLTSEAPNTVANFRQLADEKFYDGLSFHQVDREAGVIGAGRPPPGREPQWSIPIEENHLVFERGSVALFHPAGEPDKNTCMFMISLSRRPGMSDLFTIFGKVIEGIDVAERISRVETTGPDGQPPNTPLERVTIHSITVGQAPY